MVHPVEKFSPLASCKRGEGFSWDFPEAQIWTEVSGYSVAINSSVEYHRGQGKTWQNLLGLVQPQGNSLLACIEFCTWHRTPFWILPWKEVFLGRIIGSPLLGKILTCFLPLLIFLLNPCLPLNTGRKHRHCVSKIEESKSHCLITNDLRKKDSD